MTRYSNAAAPKARTPAWTAVLAVPSSAAPPMAPTAVASPSRLGIPAAARRVAPRLASSADGQGEEQDFQHAKLGAGLRVYLLTGLDDLLGGVGHLRQVAADRPEIPFWEHVIRADQKQHGATRKPFNSLKQMSGAVMATADRLGQTRAVSRRNRHTAPPVKIASQTTTLTTAATPGASPVSGAWTRALRPKSGVNFASVWNR